MPCCWPGRRLLGLWHREDLPCLLCSADIARAVDWTLSLLHHDSTIFNSTLHNTTVCATAMGGSIALSSRIPLRNDFPGGPFIACRHPCSLPASLCLAISNIHPSCFRVICKSFFKGVSFEPSPNGIDFSMAGIEIIQQAVQR